MKNNLRVMRVIREMTQSDLARAAGLSRGTVNRVEGSKTLPDGATILRLSEALGVSAVRIFPILATPIGGGNAV